MDNPVEEVKAPLEGTTPKEGEEAPKAESKEEDQKVARYLEQIKGSKAEVERLQNIIIEDAVEKVDKDNGYFIELFQKDPIIAEKVAKQFWVTAKEAIDKINAARGEVKPMEKPPIDKETLFKEWEERQEQKRAKEAAGKYFEDLQPAQKEVAQKTFESLIEGKNLSAKELVEIAEMAALYVQKDSLLSDAKDKALANLSSTPLSRSEAPKNSRKEVAGARDLAKALGLEHLYK